MDCIGGPQPVLLNRRNGVNSNLIVKRPHLEEFSHITPKPGKDLGGGIIHQGYWAAKL
jgi:hypothetical protein